MSNYFAVDPESLAKNAPNVRAYSDQVRGIVSRLQSQLDALGNCWGDDPMGKAFAEQYLTPRDQMFTGLTGVSDVLDSTADGLETMAKGFAQTEAENTANARKLANGAGGTHTGSLPTDTRTSGGSNSHGATRGRP